MIIFHIVNFIMQEKTHNIKGRAKSAIPRNYSNIEVHACLDDGNLYREYFCHDSVNLLTTFLAASSRTMS
jgi:hypothetical protein